MVWYAASTRATMNSTPQLPPGWESAIASLPADSRVLDATSMHDNFGMWFGYNDVWGYDPGVLKRYAELVASSQGINPDAASQYAQFRRSDSRVFPLLRIAGVLREDPKQPLIGMAKPMELAQLVSISYVMPTRDRILAYMQSDSFNPRLTVLLESEPPIKPSGSMNPGTVQVLNESTDTIELVADLNANAILLITNAYSKGWRVKSLGPSPQENYAVLPADWALQAIPLTAGKHHLLIEYRPTAFVAGKWLSILSLVGYLGAIVWYVWKVRDARNPTPQESKKQFAPATGRPV